MTRRAAPPVARRRALSSFGLGRLLRWWLTIGALLLVAIAAFVAISGAAFDFQPLHVSISGDDFGGDIQVSGLTDGAKALLAAGAAIVVLVALLVAPLVLVVVFLAVSVALAAALLGLAIGLALATSPLWLVGLIAWWAARRRRPSKPVQEGASS